MEFDIYITEVETFEESLNYYKGYLKATNLYSLEDRWKFYIRILKYLPKNYIYMDFKSLEKIREVSWYDDFFLDRYAVMDLDDRFIERALEEFPEVNIDELKEEILQSGYSSFENDW
jgi:hypothetical protein